MLLFVEDDRIFRNRVISLFERNSISFKVASNYEEAISLLNQYQFKLSILDLYLNEQLQGPDILKHCIDKEIKYNFILSSYEENDSLAETLIEIGANSFFKKSNILIHSDEFIKNIKQVLSTVEEIYTPFFSSEKKILESIKDHSFAKKPILILGEKGVGKKTFIQQIHKICLFQGPIIHIDCDSYLSINEFKLDLLGNTHDPNSKKTSIKPGKLLQAQAGSLVFSNFHKMPKKIQSLIFTIIREKAFYPIDSSKKIIIDIQFFFSSNKNMSPDEFFENFVQDDLAITFSNYNTTLPPLRKSKNYIKTKVKDFLKLIPRKIIIKPDAFEALESYSWPMNLTELYEVISLLQESGKSIIYAKDLPRKITTQLMTSKVKDSNFIKENEIREIKKVGLSSFIRKIEQDVVKTMLSNGLNKNEVMNSLKISKSTFYRIEQSISNEQEKT